MRNKRVRIRAMRYNWAALLIACCAEGAALPDTQSVAGTSMQSSVSLKKNPEGAWRFFIDETEFPLYGAGGAEAPGLLEKLVEAGGNVTRTWGIETLERTYENGERYIDRAHRLGLKVVVGLWVQHERHGFNYADPVFIQQQRTNIVEAVKKYKNHPAVLAWGLGNEMEGPSHPQGRVPVLREVEQLARLIKAEDPDHPVMTIIAFNPAKIQNIMTHCPTIDILGLNSYGGAAGVGPALKAAGWEKPFAITEFGVHGFWEVPTTSWGAPLEPDSQAKARTYFATHELVFRQSEGHELCLGTFAFLWGWKQERTATWFGMFLPTLEKLPQVDAMTRAWRGHWPTNRCPKIIRFDSTAKSSVIPPDTLFSADIEVQDPESDTLRFEWTISSESTARSEGGDHEDTPPVFPDLIVENGSSRCLFRSPSQPGDYRLFVVIHDGNGGAATANFPFRIQH